MHVYSLSTATTPLVLPPNSTRSYVNADTSAGVVELDLPAATGTFKEVYVKNLSGANNANIKPSGTDTIDGVNAIYNLAGANNAVGLIDSAAGVWEFFAVYP